MYNNLVCLLSNWSLWIFTSNQLLLTINCTQAQSGGFPSRKYAPSLKLPQWHKTCICEAQRIQTGWQFWGIFTNQPPVQHLIIGLTAPVHSIKTNSVNLSFPPECISKLNQSHGSEMFALCVFPRSYPWYKIKIMIICK